MPLRKPDGNGQQMNGGNLNGNKFPPEAYRYDTDVDIHVVQRVQIEADKTLKLEEWVVIDGPSER